VRRARAKSDADVVPRGPHSPIPRLDELPPGLWERPSPLRGVQFDRAGQARRLRALEPHIRAFPPIAGFDLWNGYYEAFDAEVLWAILRAIKPKRVVELGSGWSSKVIAAAIEPGCQYRAFDPSPRMDVPQVEKLAAQQVPEEVFTTLEERDVLFVDTTHTVKTGGDVNRIVLDVLPLLRPGVLVHFHDVLLPWELHRTWLERGWFWFEQYLLQAFLSGNRDWEVLLGLHDLTRTEPALVREICPSWRGDSFPSAFWIRRCA
jgi:hypothetical protein